MTGHSYYRRENDAQWDFPDVFDDPADDPTLPASAPLDDYGAPWPWGKDDLGDDPPWGHGEYDHERDTREMAA